MDKLYSHKNKLLFNHLSNVSSNMLDMFDNKSIDLKVFKKNDLRKVVKLVGICHDFGKSMIFFQKKLAGKKTRLSNHALISAFFSIYLLDEFEVENKDFYKYILFIVIKNHHGSMNSPMKIKFNKSNDLTKQLDSILKSEKEVINIYDDLLDEDINIKKVFKNLGNGFRRVIKKLNRNFIKKLNDYSDEDVIEIFLTINYLFSLLIYCDKKDAAEIRKDIFNKDTQILNVQKYIEKNFESENKINNKRSEFYNDVLDSNIDKNKFIYTITAPTGIGKTLTSLGLTNRFKDKFDIDKMIYCLPYTSIIDQNYDEFEKVFKFQNSGKEVSYEDLVKHHYLTFFDSKDPDGKLKKQKLDYLDNKLVIESWDSQNIVTTFVQFLESIITIKNSRLRKFSNMINSVIVLDEIQAIPVKFYHLIGKVLEVFANRFKTYLILMTATQPNIISNSYKLVNEEKFYFDKVFNRCILKTKGLNEEITIDNFVDKFKNFNKNNALIVVNTIQSSLNIYFGIKNQCDDYIVKYLSTNLTPNDRVKKINDIKKMLKLNKKVILVTTQLIEAGVDLSFELVYRDFAPLDSIIQVAGRCNRSGELDNLGEVKLLKLLNSKDKLCSNSIYDPKLLEVTSEILTKDKYENKEFYNLSKKYFDIIKNLSTSKSNQILKAMRKLNYDGVITDLNINDFKLIKDTYYDTRVVICQTKEIEDSMYEMVKIKDKIKKEGFKSELYRNFDMLKKKIDKYTIDIYNYQLDYYKDNNLVSYISDLNMVYFSHKDQNDYIYDKEVGFLEKPKKEIKSSLVF